jgi:5-formyltetrahydrofolate cyclo-ligase
MSADKSALRQRLRRDRSDYPRSAVYIPDAFRERLAAGLIVASYIPIGSEADPSPLARAASDAGCIIALPHVIDRLSAMRFLAWQGDSALVAGPFGLSQPAPDAPECQPDIILTPLVGFDRTGARLGQGAGHYDRAFLSCPGAWRIGIAFACQEVASLPTDSWDVPLHAVATDQQWITI